MVLNVSYALLCLVLGVSQNWVVFVLLFLDIWGGFDVNVKFDLVWTLIHTHCLILHLTLLLL